MLLITTRTGRTWAWVLKLPGCNTAIACGFGYKSQDAAMIGGHVFRAFMGVSTDGQ